MNTANDLETMAVALAHDTKVSGLDPEKDGVASAFSTPAEENWEYPTEEEMKTLRRVSGQIPWTAYTIAFVELCERFSYYGTTIVCEYQYQD
jgi:POT family proton-dependent oligopeptide transporter